MATPTAQDQYMLELLNRARLNPQAEADRLLAGNLNEGLPAGTITATPKQALAFNSSLLIAAQSHSQWMLDNNTFSHTGIGGSLSYNQPNITGRIITAGYPSYSTAGENLSLSGTTGTPNITSSVSQQEDGLFVDSNVAGRGHRTNMLEASYREVGISAKTGIFPAGGTSYNAVMITQDFATDFDNPFLTGVVYTDAVLDDNFYTVGEGLGGITINAVGNGQTFSATSMTAGGYSLRLASGTYSVSFSGDFNNDGIVDTSTAQSVTIDAQKLQNVKLDFASDTYIPPAIETAGTTTLSLDSNGKYLAKNSTSSINLKYNGNDFKPTTFAGWSIVGAEIVGTDVNQMWKSTGGQFWYSTNTNNGNIITNVVRKEFEFQQDFNGNGQIGGIENAGTTTLSLNSAGKYTATNSNTTIDLIYNGSNFGPTTFAGWSIIGAEIVGSDVKQVWKNGSQYWYSTNTSTGNSVADISTYESSFEQDLNGDGVITRPATTRIAAASLQSGTVANVITGGVGNDTLVGTAGNDIFVFGGINLTTISAIGIDTITDFTSGDKIQLSKLAFNATSLSTPAGNPLLAADFISVTTDAAATTAGRAIVYNSSNGKLFYNPDLTATGGMGAATGFGTDGGQFAQLNAGLSLNNGYFTVSA